MMHRISNLKVLVVPPRKIYILREGLGLSPWFVKEIHVQKVNGSPAQPMIGKSPKDMNTFRIKNCYLYVMEMF